MNMKPSYRGHVYAPQAPTVANSLTHYIGQYRGQTFTLTQAEVDALQAPARLRYRGVNYRK